MLEVLREQDLIGKDIANKKEIEFFGKFTDEIERKLHETFFLLKYCKKYLEGDFSLIEKE